MSRFRSWHTSNNRPGCTILKKSNCTNKGKQNIWNHNSCISANFDATKSTLSFVNASLKIDFEKLANISEKSDMCSSCKFSHLLACSTIYQADAAAWSRNVFWSKLSNIKAKKSKICSFTQTRWFVLQQECKKYLRREHQLCPQGRCDHS